MSPRIVFEDEEIRVVHRPGATAFSLLTFAALAHRPKDTWIWAGPPVEKLDIEAVGVIAKRENWYPAASMQVAAPAIRALLRPRAIGYGYSMGGYAVLKYGRLLGLTHGLAVSPQVTIDPAEVPQDRRFHRYFNPLLNADMAVRHGDSPPLVFVAGDSGWEPDAQHLRDAMAQAGASLIALPYMRHAAVDRFTSTRVLDQVLTLVLAGDAAGLRAFLRRGRAASPEWHLWVGRAAEARGHRFAPALWQRAAELGAPAARIGAVRGLAARERLIVLFMQGRRAEARRIAPAVIAAQDGQPFGLLRVGELLLRRRMPDLAEACFREALETKPGLPAAAAGLSSAIAAGAAAPPGRSAGGRIPHRLATDGAPESSLLRLDARKPA